MELNEYIQFRGIGSAVYLRLYFFRQGF